MGRIVIKEGTLGGKPIIDGTRISVELVLEMLSSGMTEKEILKNYPNLKKEDIRACLEYASKQLKNEDYFSTDKKVTA